MKFANTLLSIGLVASLTLPANAQDAAADAADQAVAEAMEAAEDAVAAAAEEIMPACELRVFPTVEGQPQTTTLLSGFGVIGAVADAAANEDGNVSDAEYLRDALGPRFQVESFETIDLVAALALPEGTEVIYETPIADRDITTKVKTRLTDSASDCYAELIVTQNLYLKRAIYGRSLNNRFIFKDFREGVEEARMVRGRGGNGLSHFPPETPEGRDAADADLQQAFLANFDEYAKRFRR